MKPLTITGLALLFAVAIALEPAHGESNIDPSNEDKQFAWSETGAWINLEGDGANGVIVTPNYLAGFAWWQDFGWVNFGDGPPENDLHYSNATAEDFGVNNDGSGGLSGYAWSECCGWINFNTLAQGGSQVRISILTGEFSGYAWCEATGWIGFEGFPTHVARTAPENVGRSSTAAWYLYQ